MKTKKYALALTAAILVLSSGALALYVNEEVFWQGMPLPDGWGHVEISQLPRDEFSRAGTLVIGPEGDLEIGMRVNQDRIEPNVASKLIINGGTLDTLFPHTVAYNIPNNFGPAEVHLNSGTWNSYRIRFNQLFTGTGGPCIIFVGDGVINLQNGLGTDTLDDPYVWKSEGALVAQEGYELVIEPTGGESAKIYAFPIATNPTPANDSVVSDLDLSQLCWENHFFETANIWFGQYDVDETNYQDHLTNIGSTGTMTTDGDEECFSLAAHLPLDEFATYTWVIEGFTYHPDDLDKTGDPDYPAGVQVFQFRVITPRDLRADTWVAVDELGREIGGIEQYGPQREDKVVGMFYFLLHGSHERSGPWDITKILAENPDNPEFGPIDANHHWGESAFGYYLSDDEWVYAKHASMLADAGVDVVIFDVTNGYTYYHPYTTLCRVWQRMRDEGNDTPQIAFLFPFTARPNQAPTVERVWDDFYRPGLYPDLWFEWEGKPLIMADPDFIAGDVDAEVLDFFTFRNPEAIYFSNNPVDNQWGWLQVYPQAGFHKAGSAAFTEQVTVGVAQNAYTHLLTQFSDKRGAMGRSWHNGAKDTSPDAVKYGFNFSEQWERAYALDPAFVFITGWNEWKAKRMREDDPTHHNYPSFHPDAVFWDAYNEEYSRDLEPSKTSIGDNYYYQLIDKVRRFKGVPHPQVPSDPLTKVVNGDFSDWENVEPVFYDTIGDTKHRNHPGWDPDVQYINTTGRNDIVEARVARDKNYIYFYVKTYDDLTPYTDPYWMLLFINSDQDYTTGWEGYNYIVNISVDSETQTTVVDGSDWETVIATVNYRVNGNQMEIAIPRFVLGLTDDPVQFDFKWADNIQQPMDINEFLISGDAAPNGRFNYRYDTDPAIFQRACALDSVDADLTGNCRVGMLDLLLLAEQWILEYDMQSLDGLSRHWLTSHFPEEVPYAIELQDDFSGGLGNWTTDGSWSTAFAFSPPRSVRWSTGLFGSLSGYLDGPSVNLTNYSAAIVSFRYRHSATSGTSNVIVNYHNGSNDIQITSRPTDARTAGKWFCYKDVIYNKGDHAQFFQPDFQLKLDISLGASRNLHIDDVTIIGVP